jgi:hypothetical protein
LTGEAFQQPPDVNAGTPLTPRDPDLAFEPISIPSSERPELFMVVDTEEEFDWHAPFSRQSTGVGAIAALPGLHQVIDRFNIRPTYVIDYPVATKPEAYGVIRGLAESGRCQVGAHLHPWVTPPYTEDVNGPNSFACNLGAELEEAKLRTLTDAIETHVGIRPSSYKAGRYGLGRSTVRILQRLGFDIDISINPLMNFSGESGPDFEAFDARPFLFGRERRLLEVPCTHGFAGFARGAGLALHNAAGRGMLRQLRAIGILSRSGALNKIMLSPETSTLDEMKSVTRALLQDGVRTFTLSFHSPSVEPGHTPYVRTQADLRQFFERIESYCDFFLASLGGRPGTIEEFRSRLLPGGAAA